MNSSSSTKQRAGYRYRNAPKVARDVVVEQAMLDKGKLVNDVRNSNDVCEAVRDRLCLWPTGDEVIALLMMLKSDQICKSYKPSAVVPKPQPSPAAVNFNEEERLSRKSNLTVAESMIDERGSMPSSRNKRISSVVPDARPPAAAGSRTKISPSQRSVSIDEKASPSLKYKKLSRTISSNVTDVKSAGLKKMKAIEEID